MYELTSTKIKNGFFPAVPVIVDETGDIDVPVMQDYVDWLSPQEIAGVAVWAHTGRGLKLDRLNREKVAEMWRRKLGEKLLICGVGSQAGTIDDVVGFSLEMARHARDCGADVLLAFPPACLIDRPHHDILRYHSELTEVGLPILAFYLYEAGGGIHYDDQLLRQILELPGVVGLKVATLDSVMRFQEIAQLMTEFPQKVLVTGEDRMLGYTLMRGATTALVGLGGVHTAIQLGMFEAWHQRDYSTFIRLSKLVDILAEVTFVEPMEGYIGRVLYCLGVEGIIPTSATRDPWGPTLTAEEKRRIVQVMDYLRSTNERM